MPTFVTLANFTDQGVKTAKDSVNRAEAVKAMGEKFGVKMKDIYWTMGAYDVVAVFEAPDGPSMSAFALAIAGAGNIRSQTLRAYPKEEMKEIVKKLP
ncbi:MAG: GYD domain-containing protein [Betaproteobacteria bacterium]|nr:GYD domain-containing protein [Betaproteobacteria bacterium]MDH4325361.1 GYD domain-containing protein [Betaproteobacteria bacterium]MDH5211956.1 GYD domain-containing protein [Betaproteobacteria bacterium]MDH5577220.1 GYD domain-containing protein [Betaproteobacteria bacterium]